MTNLTVQEWGLYIGQKIQVESALNKSGQDVLEGVTQSSGNIFLHGKKTIYNTELAICKPILRSLDQMTDDESEEFSNMFLDGEYLNNITVENYYVTLLVHPYSYNDSDIRMIDWLTRKGFAIRGEFEQGTAIKEGINEK